MLLLILFAFVAGAGTAISPCVLPVLPAVLSAGASGGRRRPLAIVLGLAATFTVTIVGFATVIDGVGLGDGALRSFAVVVLAGFGLALLFAYAMSWLGVFVGQLVPTVEVAQQVAFTTIFPITFLSNAFVPLQTLPGWLQTFAEWNPVSAVTQAARDLFGNPDPNPDAEAPTSWALLNPELYTVIWAAVILVIFVPLATAQYRRATSR